MGSPLYSAGSSDLHWKSISSEKHHPQRSALYDVTWPHRYSRRSSQVRNYHILLFQLASALWNWFHWDWLSELKRILLVVLQHTKQFFGVQNQRQREHGRFYAHSTNASHIWMYPLILYECHSLWKTPWIQMELKKGK